MTNQEKALKMHEEWNGKLETIAKSHVKTREDLAIAYTPGVAEPCKVIAEDKEQGLVSIAEPVGVICGVTPTTNPTSITIFKALIAL